MSDLFKKMYLSLFTLSLIFELLHAEHEETKCKGNILLPDTETFKAYAKVNLSVTKNKTIPKKFDARLKWPNCKTIRRIQDQEQCGGCWAFSSTSVIADRICIASGGKYDIHISVEDLLECCVNCTSKQEGNLYPGCTEGYVHKALEWFMEKGIVTGGREGCKPLKYSVIKGKYGEHCVDKCTNSEYSIPYKKDKWYAKKWGFLDLSAAKDKLQVIKRELMTNGPMIATFNIFRYMNDLLPGSIIRFNESLLEPNEKPTLHAVKLIGWDVMEDGIEDGTKNGTHVWIIANSWGQSWCEGGFCNIEIKDDQLMFQAYMTVVPKMKNYEYKPKEKKKTENHNRLETEHLEADMNGYSNIFFRTHGLPVLTFIILVPQITIQLAIII